MVKRQRFNAKRQCSREVFRTVTHWKLIQQGRNEQNYELFNLGIGEGVSVLEAVHAFEKANGVTFPYRIGPRRAGDVVAIYANNDRAKSKLGWQPSRSIEDIMRSAWQWEKKRSEVAVLA